MSPFVLAGVKFHAHMRLGQYTDIGIDILVYWYRGLYYGFY